MNTLNLMWDKKRNKKNKQDRLYYGNFMALNVSGVFQSYFYRKAWFSLGLLVLWGRAEGPDRQRTQTPSLCHSGFFAWSWRPGGPSVNQS